MVLSVDEFRTTAGLLRNIHREEIRRAQRLTGNACRRFHASKHRYAKVGEPGAVLTPGRHIRDWLVATKRVSLP